MNEIVMFCGGPADIQYALSIYHRHKGKSDISFFVTNVEGIYRFLKSLNLELKELVYLPYPADFSFKNPLKVLQVKRYITKIYEKHFEEIANASVHFFSHFHDWIAFSLTSKLATKNSVYFIDHYDKDMKVVVPEHCNLKERIKLKIYQYITGGRFRWMESGGSKRLELLYERYGIIRKEAPRVDEKIYKLYLYETDDLKERSILLFNGDHFPSGSIVNYDEIISRFADALTEKGFHICVKPHPRLGYSKILDKYDVIILPSYVPGEFIDESGFVAIVGVETVATAKFARNDGCPVYSVIDLFEFRDEEVKIQYKDYLMNQSEGKIMFVGSLDDLIRRLSC